MSKKKHKGLFGIGSLAKLDIGKKVEMGAVAGGWGYLLELGYDKASEKWGPDGEQPHEMFDRQKVGWAEIAAGLIVPEFFQDSETANVIGIATIAVGGSNLRRHHAMTEGGGQDPAPMRGTRRIIDTSKMEQGEDVALMGEMEGYYVRGNEVIDGDGYYVGTLNQGGFGKLNQGGFGKLTWDDVYEEK